mgnify:CR=1 FL=1
MCHFFLERREEKLKKLIKKKLAFRSLSLFFFFWRGGTSREDSRKPELLGTTIHARVVVTSSSMVVLVCRVYFLRSYINLSFDLIEFFFFIPALSVCAAVHCFSSRANLHTYTQTKNRFLNV